jgi:hypothetical protein
MLTRPIAAMLLVTCIPQFTGCTVHSTQRVSPREASLPTGSAATASLRRIIGVTTLEGDRFDFDTLSARLVGDTLYALVQGRPFHVGIRHVVRIRVTRGADTLSMTGSELALLAQPAGEQVLGVTTVDGRDVPFSPAALAYLSNDTLVAVTEAGQPIRLPMRDIQRVWVRRVDAGLSTLATLGAVAVVAGAVAIIVAASKPEPAPQPTQIQSCPFVYSWDGTQYVFDAEPYGGATTRGLERDDYAELEHLQPVDGEYRLMVTNEMNETQYTNLMELLVVDHQAGVRVIPDEHGGLHALAALQPPRAARDRDGRDLLAWLARTDRLIWEPAAAPDSAGNLRQQVTLTFAKPRGATTARLVANVATGQWGSQMIRAMLELWGRDVHAYDAALDERQSARDSLLAWNLREELFALKIAVEEPTGWQVRGILPGGGPLIAEDRVVPLDVSRAQGDSVRIRLEPPLGFWAFNAFGLDFGAAVAVRVDTLALVEARDSVRSVRAELAAADERYYAMPNRGDHAYLTFRAPAARAGLARTVFLHSRGYYRLHLDATAAADTATLRRLREQPGAAARLAAERFGQWQLAHRAPQ